MSRNYPDCDDDDDKMRPDGSFYDTDYYHDKINMEISIQRDYANNKAFIYLLGGSRNSMVREGYSYNSEDQTIIVVTLQEEEVLQTIKPFLVLPIRMADELVKAFTNLGSEMNIKTENENLLKGKLEATQLHLEDMRELTKHLIIKKK